MKRFWKNWAGTIPATFPGKKLGQIKLAKIKDVPALCQRIAGVIQAVNPDIIGIEEGPPRKDQMGLFVSQFLNGQYAVFQSNERQQSIFALVRKSLLDHVLLSPSIAAGNGAFRSWHPVTRTVHRERAGAMQLDHYVYWD